MVFSMALNRFSKHVVANIATYNKNKLMCAYNIKYNLKLFINILK